MGYLQFYRLVGLGGNHSVEALKDPYFNMQLGADLIAQHAGHSTRESFMRQHWTTWRENSGYGLVPDLYHVVKAEGWVSGGSSGAPAGGSANPPAPVSPSLSGGLPMLPLLLMGAVALVLLDD